MSEERLFDDELDGGLPEGYQVEVISELYFSIGRDEIEETADDFQAQVNEYVEQCERPLKVEYANVTIDHMSRQNYRVLREAMVHYQEDDSSE